MKTGLKIIKWLVLFIIITVLCVSCVNKNGIGKDYILIAELKSSDEYLPETNNIKVYGKTEDEFGNFSEIKLEYKGKVLILHDEIKMYPGFDMERIDSRRMNLVEFKDIDIIALKYSEIVSDDEILQNILLIRQDTFSMMEPDTVNISINKVLSKDKITVEGRSYNMFLAQADKIDSEIFDKKTIISSNKRIIPNIEVFALKKDKDSYTDMYVEISGMNKIIPLSGFSRFINVAEPGLKILDLNNDKKDELIIYLSEKTDTDEITYTICFVDMENAKIVSLSDLKMENVVKVTAEYDNDLQVINGESYKYKRYRYVRKEPFNEANFDADMLEKLRCTEDGNICLSLLNDPISHISEDGNPNIFVLQKDDIIKFYQGWTIPIYSEVNAYDATVEIQSMDLDNDQKDEIVMVFHTGSGTETSAFDLHIIDGETLEQMYYLKNRDIETLLSEYVNTHVYIDGKDVKYDIRINNVLTVGYVDSLEYNENIKYGEQLGLGRSVGHILDKEGGKIKTEVSAYASINTLAGHFIFNITLSNGKIAFSRIEFVQNLQN